MARLVSALQFLVPLALGGLVGYAGLAVWETAHAEGGIPSILLIQPSNGATVAGTVRLWAVASDVGFSGVRFQVNGVDLGSEITAGSCSRDWDTARMADGSYSLRALARTDAGLQAGSDPAIVTVANAAPQIFDIKAWNISDTGASITWYTLQAADAQLDFGVTTLYGQRTTRISDASLIHTQVLTGLSSGTRYHFRVYSQNAIGRRSTSADQTFTTTGQSPAGGPAAPAIASLAGLVVQGGTLVASAVVGAGPVRISNIAARATSTTVRISWTTDQAADSQIRYGDGRFQGGAKLIDAALATSHSVLLTDLTPGTIYLYQVQSRNRLGRTTASATLKFTTAR